MYTILDTDTFMYVPDDLRYFVNEENLLEYDGNIKLVNLKTLEIVNVFKSKELLSDLSNIDFNYFGQKGDKIILNKCLQDLLHIGSNRFIFNTALLINGSGVEVGISLIKEGFVELLINTNCGSCKIIGAFDFRLVYSLFCKGIYLSCNNVDVLEFSDSYICMTLVCMYKDYDNSIVSIFSISFCGNLGKVSDYLLECRFKGNSIDFKFLYEDCSVVKLINNHIDASNKFSSIEAFYLKRKLLKK